jgi:phage gp45-like
VSTEERLYRRILMGSAASTVTATDDSGPVHKVQVKVTPHETIDDMPVVQLYGVASHAPTDSDAMAIFVTGDRSKGVIVATNNRKLRLRNLPSGASGLYDSAGTVITLNADGSISVTCSGEVKITAPLVTISGDLHVAGDVVAGTVSLRHHVLSGVQPGGGDTGPPVP